MNPRKTETDSVFLGMVSFTLTFILTFTFLIPERVVNKEMEGYYNTYVHQLNTICPGRYKEPHQMIVDIKPLPKSTIGLCIRLFTKRYMYVDTSHWTYSNEFKRKQVLYHELSHCLLDKEHVDDYNHYMYFQDTEILPHVFESQVIADMREYCKQ